MERENVLLDNEVKLSSDVSIRNNVTFLMLESGSASLPTASPTYSRLMFLITFLSQVSSSSADEMDCGLYQNIVMLKRRQKCWYGSYGHFISGLPR